MTIHKCLGRYKASVALPLLVAAALSLGAGCQQNSVPMMMPDTPVDPTGPVADCKGMSLTSDGSIDVDVKTLWLSGRVTLNGEELPSSSDDRGTLRFVEKNSGTSGLISLDQEGPVFYQALLAPAEYDVVYVPGARNCLLPGNKLPCMSGVVKRGLKLARTGALDLDIATVTVSGGVTVNGAAPAAPALDTAAISFTRTDDGSGLAVSTALLGSFLHNYSVVLLSGTYDVAYLPPEHDCLVNGSVPCVQGPLHKGVVFNSSGVHDVDIPTVQVSGRITVNGQPPTKDQLIQGALNFQLHAGGNVAPSADLMPYQLTLLAGTYDVRFAATGASCKAGLPCVSGRLKADVGLQTGGVLDVDIPTVSVQGKVTINGQPVDPDSESSRLVFMSEDSDLSPWIWPEPAHKLSSYQVTLIPGVYQVVYEPANSAACSQSPGQAPCIGGVVKKDLAVTQSVTLDVDVPVITVGGHVTVNGSAISSSAAAQGRVVFALQDGYGDRLLTDGLGPYQLRLLPGTYSVSFQGGVEPSQCSVTSELPCTDGLISDNLSLSKSDTRDLDLALVRISGGVTLDGKPMPDSMDLRGQLRFSANYAQLLSPSFGRSGAVSYSAALLKGTYGLFHTPFSAVCGSGADLPCVGQAVLGCQ